MCGSKTFGGCGAAAGGGVDFVKGARLTLAFTPETMELVTAPVAQLDRVPASGAGGRAFESRRARHYSNNRCSGRSSRPPLWNTSTSRWFEPKSESTPRTSRACVAAQQAGCGRRIHRHKVFRMKKWSRTKTVGVLLLAVTLGALVVGNREKLSWRGRLVWLYLSEDVPGVRWSDVLAGLLPAGTATDTPDVRGLVGVCQ